MRSFRIVALAATACAAALGLAHAASAETYSGGSGTVCVGTNGSDAKNGGGCGLYPAVTVSQGGCAEGTHVAVAVGESGRCYNGAEAQGPVAVGLLGADVMPWSCCWMPTVGVSDSGYAYSFSSTGGYTVSGTGDARSYGCTVVLSTCVLGGAVSGSANAYGATAVSGTGTATGATAVSGTGHAEGGTAAVSGTGSADGGTAAVAGDDAHASGGLVAVSLTGNACGGSVTSLAPMGHAC